MEKNLKGALAGALVGAIGGPLGVGLLGFVMLSLAWTTQGWLEGWSNPEFASALAYAAGFGVLIAPFGASAGALIGVVIGGFSRWFGSEINAASFGGFIGAVVGLIAGIYITGSGDLAPFLISFIAMTVISIGVAIAAKRLHQRLIHTPLS